MSIDYEAFARKYSDKIMYLQYEGHEPVFMLPRNLIEDLGISPCDKELVGAIRKLHKEEGLFKRIIPQWN